MTVIKFENMSKQYRLGLVSTRTLKHDLNRWVYTTILRRDDPYLKIGEINDRSKKGTSEYVWALRNINFDIKQGEVVGIIGKNGSGKSTLLKILSKITAPTIGTIKSKGRIASLLEVGTGFHPQLTGRENIYMNGCILGMKKDEISRKLDEIVDFSGVERYVDTPVKRYSSGMTVRLGFSIAAHLEPEILVVDEVLAVGDAEFQKKAIGKMQDVSKGNGRTVLFVSHNMGAVKKLCKTGIVLEDGQIKFAGNIAEVIDCYLDTDVFSNIYRPVNNVVKEITAIQNGGIIEMTLKYESNVPIKQPSFGFVLYDNYDNPIIGTNPIKSGVQDFGTPRKNGSVKIEISSPCLADGLYGISVWFSDGIVYSGPHIFQEEKCVYLNISKMHNNPLIKKETFEGSIIPIIKFDFN